MSSGLVTGRAVELAPGIRRVLAPNPGVMTGPGTNTYLLGERDVAVIDPGPANAAHVAAIFDNSPGDIKWILVTHTHVDHSPAARLLAQQTGATLLGRTAPPGMNQDQDFVPDRALRHGDSLATEDFTLHAVHTPGHASNHLCYLLDQRAWLFTGDHVMNGSTVVINPPDGNMQQYLDSLRRVQALHPTVLAPGHGELINEPQAAIAWIIDHRLEREAEVIAALRAHPKRSALDLVALVYRDVGEHLHKVAARSLLAHLLKLQDEDRAACDRDRWHLIER